MIENISYHDAELDREINGYVGRSYTFWESLRMGGTGSQRLVIEEFHPVFEPFLNIGHHTKKCNIERRKLGIAVRFRYRLETIGWFISFDKVAIRIEGSGFTLTDSDSEIWLRLRPSGRSQLNHKFLKQIQDA